MEGKSLVLTAYLLLAAAVQTRGGHEGGRLWPMEAVRKGRVLGRCFKEAGLEGWEA